MQDVTKRIMTIGLFISLLLCGSPVFARNNSSWKTWVRNLRKEAIADGIRPQLFDQVFYGMTPSSKHIRLDRTQPETRLTYYKYRNTRADKYRITIGRIKYKKHKQLLHEIGQRYGVSPCFIVALWGLESSYGHFVGNFDVIRSLATLAYDGRRSAFFHKELLLALHMLNDGHIRRADFKGEWAGASGQAQFLPSSWYKYAVDYNRDGFKDIWKTYADIFASIANYLVQNGWATNEPVLTPVILPANFNKRLLGLNHNKTVREWQNLGVQIKHDINPYLYASIIHPYGGPVFMIFNNYKVLLEWNYSLFYAATVNYTANNICRT